MTDPREIPVAEGLSAPQTAQEYVLGPTGLDPDQEARVAALMAAKQLLAAEGNHYPGLRAQAGELTALATFILSGRATWTDDDDDDEDDVSEITP